jgi:hypothetical protein
MHRHRNSGRHRRSSRITLMLTEMLLAWLMLAPGLTPGWSETCGVEAQVLIERIGPKGTSAVAWQRFRWRVDASHRQKASFKDQLD